VATKNDIMPSAEAKAMEGPTDSSTGSPSAPGRFARWWAGWRVAIRIARRDARRYKWRSALIVVMVGLPVLLLTSGITLMAANDVSLAESVPRHMGAGQARVSDGGDEQLSQSPDSRSSISSGQGGVGVRKVLTVPGFAPGSAWTTEKVQGVTGGRVIPTVSAWVRVTQGDRRPSMPLLGLDGRDRVARGMTELVSGRWPKASSEIVVTEAGIAEGLPRTGLLTAGPDGKSRQLTVVGVASGHADDGLPFLVALPDLAKSVSDPERLSSAFLVDRAEPVSWSDVRRMNTHGLVVKSRQVFQNPPPASQLDPKIEQSVSSDQRDLDVMLLLAAVGLFIETTLLAGPAFAVSAARQRRSLALAASNGAEARQLRRYVLGQAVVLGIVSAAIAAFAGVLLTMAGLTWWQAGHADFVIGPLEVSWLRVIGVFVCAVVASVVAALIPAKGIARLDIVSVLAGRVGDHSVRRGLPVGGVFVMAASGLGLIWAVASGGTGGLLTQEFLIVGGAVGLVVGCLMVVPAVLALVGRLGTHLKLPLRLAARDTARQRGRSTPAVAAIMAAVAAMTTISIGAASYTRHGEDTYKAQRPMGTGVIMLNGEDSDERSVRAVLNRFAPQLTADRQAYVGYTGPATTAGSRTISWVSPVPPGCTEAQVLALQESQDGVTRCPPLATGVPMADVGDLSTVSAKLALSTSQRRVLEAGGILVTDPGLVRDGQVSYVAGNTGTQKPSGKTTGTTVTQRTSFPAVVVDGRVWDAAFHSGPSGVWILPNTAKRLGWPLRVTSFSLTSPTGTISPEVERAVTDRLGDGYSVEVERGFQNRFWMVFVILLSVTGLLVLVASLISTALSLAESQNDMATLAAVGATRHTRRGIAAGQAFVVAVCGCLLGVAVGMIPGIALTWPLTVRSVSAETGQAAQGMRTLAERLTGPVIEIPWLSLLAIVVLVPLLAAGLAWIAVRRHPQMTRRLA